MIIKNSRNLPTRILVSALPSNAPSLSVILKATFVLESSQTAARLAPKQLPILESDVPLHPDTPDGLIRFESDLVPFKPRTDIVLVGDACAPHTRPTRTLDVEIRVGAVAKVLRVFGDRRWSMVPGQNVPILVGPVDFVRMPLSYERAFGGVDQHASVGSLSPGSRPWYAKNPYGQGYIAARTVKAIHDRPLANIEDPAHPVRSWDTCPPPAGCAFFPRGNEARLRHAGTYDAKWKTQRAPAPPQDFAFDFYNGAHPELQAPSYLVGTEAVRLKHVDPDAPTLAFWLPGWLPKLRVRRRVASSATHAPPPPEPPFRLDTLVFIPAERCFYQVWRARLAVQSPDLAELETLYIDYDLLAPGESPQATAAPSGYVNRNRTCSPPM
jgi:hypothetical protein